MDFTDEEYSEWKALRVTKEIIRRFEQQRQEIAEYLISGATLDDHKENATALQVGKAMGLDYFITGEYLE